MSRRLLAAVAAAALTCGISACTEGQESARTDPPADVVADAPSDGGGESPVSDGGGDAEGADAADGSTSAAADLPAPDPADFPGMDENTPEGAEQTFRFFAAHLIWSYQAGDVDVLDSLSGSDCDLCRGNVEQIRKLADDDELWTSATIKDVNLVSERDDEDFDVMVAYRASVSAHIEPSLGRNERDVPARDYVFGGGMVWDGEGWIVSDASLSIEDV